MYTNGEIHMLEQILSRSMSSYVHGAIVKYRDCRPLRHAIANVTESHGQPCLWSHLRFSKLPINAAKVQECRNIYSMCSYYRITTVMHVNYKILLQLEMYLRRGDRNADKAIRSSYEYKSEVSLCPYS